MTTASLMLFPRSILRFCHGSWHNPTFRRLDARGTEAIRVGERTRFLEVGRITHFFTQGRLTFAAADGKTYAVDWTIAELEQKLGPSRFFRIHRGTLVNLDWLEELTPLFTGRMAARLKDEKRTGLTVARDRVRLLKRHLGL
jgi:DNA-binding LytR/AlgR family response regulator